MSKPIRSYSDQRSAVLRRLTGESRGLGFISALNWVRRHHPHLMWMPGGDPEIIKAMKNLGYLG